MVVTAKSEVKLKEKVSGSCRTSLVACFCKLSCSEMLKVWSCKLVPHGFPASSAICVVQKLNCYYLLLDA